MSLVKIFQFETIKIKKIKRKIAEKELKIPIKKFGSIGLEPEEPMGEYELDE